LQNGVHHNAHDGFGMKLGHSFLSGVFRVQHVSNTDMRMTCINEMSNLKDIF